VQPHTLPVPPPPHVTPVPLQVPQDVTVRLVPQLSAAVTLPQFLPSREQNAASPSYVQPHTFAVPPPAHVCGDAHVPHGVTVRLVPQLSAAVTLPQFFPSRVQNGASPSYVQPHTLAVPPPAHVTPVPLHVPHEAAVRAPPQLSVPVTLPQFFPSRLQNAVSPSYVQPHTFAVPPPPHVTPVPLQVPHEPTVRAPPQLSVPDTLPQFFTSRVQNAAFVSAVQPQTFAVPLPPHVTPVPLHAPQDATVRVVPQLSAAVTLPQFFPRRVQNAVSPSYVQPHTFAVPPPAQVCGDVHVPQSAVRDDPQLSFDVTLPQFFPSRVQNAPVVSAVQPHTFAVPPPPHVTPVPEHVPQLAVREAPQLSFATTLPQFFPSRVQNAVSVSVVQPHTFAAPPPPHVTPVPEQAPHEATVRDAPQLSVPSTLPQFFPSRMQNAVSVSPVQPHTFAVPPPAQVCGDVHVPHDDTVRPVPQLS
jgi:hypothetical protein